MLRQLTIFLLINCLCLTVQAQNDSIPKRVYPPVNENDLIETKWRYAFTEHVDMITALSITSTAEMQKVLGS